MRITMTKLTMTLALALGVTSAAGPAHATEKSDADAARAAIEKLVGFVPAFMKAIPDRALPGAWGELEGLEANPKTAIPCRYKELIGLAVAAQVPCPACVYGYTRLAKVNGASDAQVGEAVVEAGLTRHWSTVFNGLQLDEGKFRAEIKQATDGIKKAMGAQTPPPAPLAVVDAKSALQDVEQTYGFVPEFVRRFPPSALPGAWLQMRAVEVAPETALPDKYKSLISLAVAAQIPCRYCAIADTEFAKLAGATDQEISEAVAMSGLARDYATLIVGLQVDEAGYRRDMDRLAKAVGKYVGAHASTPSGKGTGGKTAATASR